MKNLAKSASKFVSKNVKAHELVLSALLLLYVFSGVSTPSMLVPYVHNYILYIVAFFIVLVVFTAVSPLVGILFAIAFLVLFRRTPDLKHLESSEESKSQSMADLNSNFSIPLDFPKNAKGEVIQTKNLDNNLEVEVVEKMAPTKEFQSLGNGAYEPIQAGGINASEL